MYPVFSFPFGLPPSTTALLRTTWLNVFSILHFLWAFQGTSLSENIRQHVCDLRCLLSPHYLQFYVFSSTRHYFRINSHKESIFPQSVSRKIINNNTPLLNFVWPRELKLEKIMRKPKVWDVLVLLPREKKLVLEIRIRSSLLHCANTKQKKEITHQNEYCQTIHMC